MAIMYKIERVKVTYKYLQNTNAQLKIACKLKMNLSHFWGSILELLFTIMNINLAKKCLFLCIEMFCFVSKDAIQSMDNLKLMTGDVSTV